MSSIRRHIENSGYSLKHISKKSNISELRLIELIELNISPSIIELRSLSKALDIPVEFILEDKRKYENQAEVLFRTTAKSSKEKYSAEKTTFYINNVLEIVTKNFRTKLPDFSQFPVVSNTYEDAKMLSIFFRHNFFSGDLISPLIDLHKLIIEKLNCIIYIKNLGVVGASAIVNSVPFIFLSPQFAPRMLFTLAHELGHLLAHHNGNSANLDISINELGSKKRNQESFANAFASNLLLPDEAIGIFLKKTRAILSISGPVGDIEINYLARFYGISFEVAARRCEDVGLLPEGSAVSMYEKIKSTGSNPEKRAAENNLPARLEFVYPRVSSNLVSAAIERISNGDISIGRASEILSLPISDLVRFNSDLN